MWSRDLFGQSDHLSEPDVALLKQSNLLGAQLAVVGMRFDFFSDPLQFLIERCILPLELIKLRLFAHGLIRMQISRQGQIRSPGQRTGPGLSCGVERAKLRRQSRATGSRTRFRAFLARIDSAGLQLLHHPQEFEAHRPFTSLKSLLPARCEKCSGRDLNPHGLRHTPLKRTCLPVPPPELLRGARRCSEVRTMRKESFRICVSAAATTLWLHTSRGQGRTLA
jgi:hypothetical protein